jgi:hypothetical protein
MISFRSLVDDGGARLKQLLSALRQRGMGTFRLSKVHQAEVPSAWLETLGFKAVGRHLLYAGMARSA